MTYGYFAASAGNLQQTAGRAAGILAFRFPEQQISSAQSRKFTTKPAMRFRAETIDANVAYSVKTAIFNSAPFARHEQPLRADRR
jgi:hypothetical protein